jgi:hypothetical protein
MSPEAGVLVLPEPDYRYGTGTLMLRVERIDRSRVFRYDDEDWYQVWGNQIGYDGRELGHREVLVRGRRLPPWPDQHAARWKNQGR